MKSFTPLSIDLKNFIKNKSLKETLSSMNFTSIQHIIISIQQHQQLEKNQTTIQSTNEFYHKIMLNLKNNLFHLKGRLLSLKYSIDTSNISNELFFNCDLVIRDELCEYQLKAYHIRKGLADKFQKLKKEETTLYFTNLKSAIAKNDKSNSTSLFFSISLMTKIYAESKTILDHYNRTYDYKMPSWDSNNNASQLKLDLSTNNELEFIESLDDKKIDKLIKKVSLKTVDFAWLLTMKLPSMLIPTTKVFKFDSSSDNLVNIMGIVSSIIHKDNLCIIEVYSLIDTNQIKINIFNDKNLTCDIKPRMVILFNNFNHKLNKKYDIVLTNKSQSSIQVVGLINESEYERMMKYQYRYKQIKFSSIISLLTNDLKRDIRKYMINIRHIFKIQAETETNYMKIPNHPHLKLFGKMLIDDGSYEAISYFYDMTIVKMMSMTPEQLEMIVRQIQGSGSLIIYDKYYQSDIIQAKAYSEILIRQYIVYGNPFVNSFGKTNPEVDFAKYIQNLEDKKSLSETVRENYIFINGNILNDKSNEIIRDDENNSNGFSNSITCRPYLMISGIETIDD